MHPTHARLVALFGTAISLALGSAAHAQTITPSFADLRTWELEGVSGGNWRDPANLSTPFANALSGRAVYQTVNNTNGTMFLVSNDTNVINRVVWGTLRVSSTHTDNFGVCSPSPCGNLETDNDWIGFAMGYVNVAGNAAIPEHYIGFTWNRTLEAGNPAPATSPYLLPAGGPATEGIFLLRANPPATNGDPTGGGATLLDSDTGAGTTGWRYDTDYQFRIVYATNRIRVYINDLLRLEATPAQAGLGAFPTGQFGFTNASQGNVMFSNVLQADASTINTAPVATDDKFYYGLTWGTEGNVFDTDTDPRAVGILDNDYDPDGDPFVLRVGGVSLPTPGSTHTIIGTQGGSFQVFGNGRIRYTAPADYQTRGPFQDTFLYTIVDEDGERSATVTLTVQQTNTLPNDITLADGDTGSTSDIRVRQGSVPGTLVGSLTTIETNPGELDEYDYELQDASNGAFEVIGDKVYVRDTTALGGVGTRTIVVRSTDVEGQSVTQTFSIHVDPNVAPTSANSSVNVNAAAPFAFGLANFPFTDGDGDLLQNVVLTSFPAHGTLFIDFDNDNVADANEIPQLNVNDVVTRAQLTGGRLKYLSNSATDTTTSFGFRVNDGGVNSVAAHTMTVNVEADTDNDGIPNTTEGTGDADGDGTPNYLDTDSDGDGIPDATEGTGNPDGDGLPNYLDPDSDGDGIPDATEGMSNTDGDGLPNYLDTDSDGDGIPDSTETAGDADGDGIPNFLDNSVDTDHDGVPDVIEGNADGDGDGLPDFRDPDSDNDGIPDFIESGAYGFDSDNDGIDDRWDANSPGATDPDGDGIANNVPLVDTDADGVADMRDLDSDRDGISDAVESGATGADSDGDGIDDAFDVDSTGGTDANGNGIADNARARDTDQDGVPDYLDLDSDDDSFSDVSESNGLDVNGDALLDAGGTITSTPIDTDGDGRPNYRDVDANGDGVLDIKTTRYAGLDANNDGRIDVHGVDADGDGIADAIDVEPGQRGTRLDGDGDGVPADRDLDDDGDGIPDSVEGDGDLDGDGTIDRLDRDSDNDGIPDRVELGLPRPSGVDANGNGIDDAYETLLNRDSDNDGIPDYRDTDSDNDGIPDSVEVSLVPLTGRDSDGDGIDDAIDVDSTRGVDANGDGVDDALLQVVDTDGDGIPDYRDADSDNDGIPDGKENGDFNNDGINDRLQKEMGLKTGLKGGGGGGSFELLGLVFLLALAGLRMLRTSRRRVALVAGALVVCATPLAQAAEVACTTGEEWTDGCWAVGLGAYQTRLAPDDSRSTWRVVDTSDSGFKLSVEYRFYERWSLELGYADMGSATVVNRNPSIGGREPVNYKVPSLLAGFLLLEPSSRVNIQVKAGYARLETDADFDIIDEQIKSNQLTLGAAVRARILTHLELQLVHEYYDTDARQTGLEVRYAF